MRKTILLTSLFWIGTFASCASSEVIKTWIIVDKDHVRHHTNDVDELKTIADVVGYRCYSKIDDTAWRSRMNDLSACCDAK